MVLNSGMAVVGNVASNDLWFRIQLDAVQDLLRAMRYMPHWRPVADHLFEWSCAPTDVAFAPRDVRYNVSCAAGEEILKVTFKPTRVTAGGLPLPLRVSGAEGGGQEFYEFDADTGLLVVAHARSGIVRVQGSG